MNIDACIRKVGMLGDRARRLADKMGLKEDDLVIVRTEIKLGRPPIYRLEKIDGSPLEHLRMRMSQ